MRMTIQNYGWKRLYNNSHMQITKLFYQGDIRYQMITVLDDHVVLARYSWSIIKESRMIRNPHLQLCSRMSCINILPFNKNEKKLVWFFY